MSYEAFSYAQKRVRSMGTREWKLWFTEGEDPAGSGLDFRMLAKDSAGDCYISVNGRALAVSGDPPVQEDENGEAYFTDHYRYMDSEGGIDVYLEAGEGELVWVRANGGYDHEGCTFTVEGPLMPEVAG